jgi:hypothetical protein
MAKRQFVPPAQTSIQHDVGDAKGSPQPDR